MNTQLDGAVVVGVAESVFNGDALRWAAEQAQLERCPLTLVNASGPVSGAWAEHGMTSTPRSSASLERHGQGLLDRAQAVVEQITPGVGVGRMFAVADPATLLLTAASTAHLVVLGSRGRGTVRSHLFGSIGLSVVRHAACPVIIHRPGDHPGSVHRGVVVAADATESSRPVLVFAFRQAELRRLPLYVQHCVPAARAVYVGAPMIGVLPEEDIEEHQLRLAESMAGLREQYPDVFVQVDTSRGVPEQDLLERAEDADLTVLGSHQRSLMERALVGSVSTSVCERAHGPVAIVPQGR
jgi:nucleotide-binding universal stress UspA family protein